MIIIKWQKTKQIIPKNYKIMHANNDCFTENVYLCSSNQ